MKFKTQRSSEKLLKIMPVLAWVVLILYVAEAGAILISYTISCINPEGTKDFYMGLNLYDLRQFGFWYYTGFVFFMVALPLMKSWISFLVIKTLSKFNLKNPFSMEVARRLEKICFATLGTWFVTLLSNIYTSLLMKITGKLYGNWLSTEFIFMVGLLFIITTVFKRGVEIQSENELTV
ncbi:MAG TPA: DUF2975 domain-containing protein [Puia sp.]|nr:DUF2975 domain-containing protein [Puia sp.]